MSLVFLLVFLLLQIGLRVIKACLALPSLAMMSSLAPPFFWNDASKICEVIYIFDGFTIEYDGCCILRVYSQWLGLVDVWPNFEIQKVHNSGPRRLIDWREFFALSAIFQPCNGGPRRTRCPYETQVSPIMANSKDGQGHKDYNLDTSSFNINDHCQF